MKRLWRVVPNVALSDEAKEAGNSKSDSSSSQLSSSIIYSPLRLRTTGFWAGRCSFNDLCNLDPPRAVLSSHVSRTIGKNLESVERVFDLDGKR